MDIILMKRELADMDYRAKFYAMFVCISTRKK